MTSWRVSSSTWRERSFRRAGARSSMSKTSSTATTPMPFASKVNVYLGTEQPWHTIKTDRERAGTVLYVALRCVDNLKTMFAPFLPFSSQRLHAMLGYDDAIAPQPEVRQFAEDATAHMVITGDYESRDRWHPSELRPGRKLPTPEPLLKRLDEVVEEPPSS